MALLPLAVFARTTSCSSSWKRPPAVRRRQGAAIVSSAVGADTPQPPKDGGGPDASAAKSRPQRFSGFAELGRALGQAPPASSRPIAAAYDVCVPAAPVLETIYGGTVVSIGEGANGSQLTFIHFFGRDAVGLLHNADHLCFGDKVDVVLVSVNAQGKYRLELAPSAAPRGGATKKKQRRPPDAPAKVYRGLGVRTWEDVHELLAAGGWQLVAENSNAHWRRTLQSSSDDARRPLIQSVYMGLSPSDSFHGPQKAATTIRRMDKERDAWLSADGA
jgi:hypothetical protein